MQAKLLLFTVGLSSAVSLVFELMVVTQATYLVGDATLATGVVVGTFLAAMGLGGWASQFLAVRSDASRSLLRALLWVELLLSPVCLLGPLGLFALFAVDGSVWLAVVLLTVMAGALAGMELPLLTRLLETQQDLRVALARALALDYFGSLLGALVFPLVLLPQFGLLPTSALLGLLPLTSGVLLCWMFPSLRRWRWPVSLLLPLVALLSGWVAPLGDRVERWLYDDPIIVRQQSRHQRLVLTRRRDDVRLYLDGQLQFSSLDEYRYHEALVHPAMARHGHPQHVLLLGAGDGLALSEILRWPSVQRVDLIELDPAVLALARRHPLLQRLHQGSLDDPRLTIHHGDAFQLLKLLDASFDVVIADFPDPSTPALARLYSVGFYGRLQGRMNAGGVFVTQASTPFFTPNVLASIEASWQQLRWSTRGYSVTVPSFGLWGFVMAQRDQDHNRRGFAPLPFQGRWINDRWLAQLPELPQDLRPDPGTVIRPNKLVQPVLVDYQRNGRGSSI
ncbi:MAG: polyamine aminopropyltransferase [Synechococcus sp.]